MTKLEKCKEQIAMVNGFPPYDKGFNPCYGDPYMVKSINETFGFALINQAIKELKEEK